MTNEPVPAFPVLTQGRTEWKVRASAYGTFFTALAGSIVLSTTVTDFVSGLPDWLEVVAYPAALAAASLLSGRAARTRPAELSPSTVVAVEKWLRGRLR